MIFAIPILNLSNVKINQAINQIYSDTSLSLSCSFIHCDSLCSLASSVLSILPCGFCSCVPFSPYHCHWHGGILGFTSIIPPGSWCVTTTTHSLYHVPFRHFWNQFHLFSFVATDKCGHHPGSSLILCPFLSIIVTGMVGSWVLHQPSCWGLGMSL